MPESGGPSAEQIAAATGATRIMRQNSDSGRRAHDLESELFGGGEHSALLELLRSDERLSSLFAGADRDRRERRERAGSSSASRSAFAQALFGQLMQSSSQRRSNNVVVNEEHLRNMTDMGFPEQRCRRALRYFNNDFESAIAHVCNTTEA